MNEQKTNRLNELRNLDAENERTMSRSKYRSWTSSQTYVELMTLVAEEQTEKNHQQAQAQSDWKNDPASERQYGYIDRLGVNLDGRKLTKGEASQIIDAVKNHQGIGQFGLSFYDGSN